MTARQEYVPGVCNIGPAEMRRRRQSGWTGLCATAVLWALFAVLRVPAPWRLLLFFPAMLGAAGFLQAAFHFCAAFGLRGVINLGPEAGRTETVEQAGYRKKDAAKARLIGLYAALIAMAVAAAGLLLPV